jgi:succinate-semialdehyde dehydrogenase/glutarate-semialdehyde dehydrogenase
MTREYQANLALYIDGSWRSGEGRDVHQVLNPATGEVLAELPLATATDLDEALATSAKGFALWRATDVNARAAVLHKTAALIRERAEHIAKLLTMEQG